MDEVSKGTASGPIIIPEVDGVSVADEPSCAGSHMFITLQRIDQVGDLRLEALAS